MKRKLFIESPSFGFGPISTSISLAKDWEDYFSVVFITFGKALNLLKESTNYAYIDLDTRIEENFPNIFEFVSKDDIFISNTNIEFSTFLLQHNMNVFIVDTLYWMWNSIPKEYEDCNDFVAQSYYSCGRKTFEAKTICKPIINYSLWEKPKEKGKEKSALVSFGGMEEPGDNSFIIENTTWMIHQLLCEFEKLGIRNVDIVGGLYEKNGIVLNTKLNVKIHGTVSQSEFRDLTDLNKYIFVSPGLTTLYELINIGSPICILPGLSVSQVYQVYDFRYVIKYPYCILWPDSEKLIKIFDSLPEIEALSYIRNYFECIVDRRTLKIKEVIHDYVKDVDSGIVTKKLIEVKELLFSNPSVGDCIKTYLERFM